MDKFEYETVNMMNPGDLNEFSSKGWRAVPGCMYGEYVLMERQLIEEEPEPDPQDQAKNVEACNAKRSAGWGQMATQCYFPVGHECPHSWVIN